MVKRKQSHKPAEESVQAELLEEQIVELPPRDALSIVDPGILGSGTPLPIPRPADTAANPVDGDPPAG